MDEIKFLEKYLGLKLPWYQKILLKFKLINEPKVYICCPRGNQKWGRYIAWALFNEFVGEENDREN